MALCISAYSSSPAVTLYGDGICYHTDSPLQPGQWRVSSEHEYKATNPRPPPPSTTAQELKTQQQQNSLKVVVAINISCGHGHSWSSSQGSFLHRFEAGKLAADVPQLLAEVRVIGQGVDLPLHQLAISKVLTRHVTHLLCHHAVQRCLSSLQRGLGKYG